VYPVSDFTNTSFKPAGEVNWVEEPETGVNSHVDPSAPVYTTPALVSDNPPAPSNAQFHPGAGENGVDPDRVLRLLYVAPNGTDEVGDTNRIPVVETIKFPVPTSTEAET